MKMSFQNASFLEICQLFGKSRQGWYSIAQRQVNARLQEELVINWILEIRQVLPMVGGLKLYKMIKPDLLAHSMKLGRDGLFDLLRKYDLLIQSKRRYARTTQSFHRFKRWPNLIEDFIAVQPDQLWVSDITYLTTTNGFIYLSLVTDAYSRKIVGYHLSQYLKASGCISALKKAITDRKNWIYPLIHHSDRGIQYCCDEYVQLLQENEISISMTQSGSPYDNALAERINGILKQEFGLYKTFKSYHQAIDPVAKAIYAYNQVRPHFSCQLETPAKKYYIEP